MKQIKKTFPVLFIMLTALLIAAKKNKIVTNENHFDDTNIIGCAPNAGNDIYTGPDGKFIAILPGWGNHAYTISTTNDSAQIYFNQGLSMYYGYHARESLASFKEAARLDSNSAMAFWGQALAMGPSYNSGYAYQLNANIPAVIERMNRKAVTANQKEKDLIAAMNERYLITDPSDKKRNELNRAYISAIKPLAEKYPNDLDIKAFYTDAVMLVHSWDFWNNDGTPKPWTPELVQNCKDILQKDPRHPAALHYYIHITEASRDAEAALFCADSLKKLFPGVAHMVHMSSHEYERIGYYAQGVDANQKAGRSLIVYDSLAKGLFQSVVVPHYLAVETYCALSGAMYEQAMLKAISCRESATPNYKSTYEQYQYMFPAFTMLRLGKWEDILKDTVSVNEEWTYAAILNDFAKGMAFAKTGNTTKANEHLNLLRSKMGDTILQIKFRPYMSSPYECSVVAENILAATIFFVQKKYNAAITAINKAVSVEDGLIYSEPKIWMLPARQYAGSFLVQLNKPGEAEKVYREDLVWNPGNGWSLLGLHQSLIAQNKKTEAEKYKPKYLNSFSHADVMPTASAY